MATIHLTTFITAPVERVFDLSRNISLHKISMKHKREEAIAGTTSGLINKGEWVTWRARHLGKTRIFTSRITELIPNQMFTDKMTKGDFKSFQHEHHFKRAENGTILIDIIKYELPYGWIGRMINRLYLRKYLENLISKRNDIIGQYAVGDKWRILK